MPHSTREDRRRFLRGLSAALAGGAATALIPQFELVGHALAAEPPAGDYRAVVCIFLYGGNDSFNMLIPQVQNEYNLYLASRGGVYDANSNPFGLGIARDALSVITDGNGKPWGMHPAMAETAPLFANGELAFMANVGSLTQPLSKSQYATDPLPPYLFSHNYQQRQWMRGHSTGTHVANGWGGLAGDLLAVQNTGLKELPPTISLFGNNLFQSGTSALPYALASSGPAELARMSSAGGAADSIRMQALEELLNAAHPQPMEARYSSLGRTSIDVNGILKNALSPGNNGDIATVFPATFLAAQLRMIARLIKVSQTSQISHKRQIYFAGLGGFDTHDNQMDPTRHAALLSQIAGGLAAFRNALQEIGMLNKVTTFTMSDFGRTLNSNGNGTDHAWGGVQMMMGGAVQGRNVWGTYPLLELDGEQSVGRGRMIPTTSAQQYAATLASWLGVGDANLATIFPGIGNFTTPKLGFMG